MATLNGLTRRSLFGGAFQIFLPSPAQDVSAFRQVPDNQEVFVNPSNNQSITVDILEAVSSSSLPEAVNLHFQEIVNCNSASDSVVDSVEIQHIPNGPPAVLLRGKQKVAKFNRLQSDLVDIAVMLYRFPDYSADVLVCFNDPIMCQDQSEVSPSGRWSDEDVNLCLHSLKLLDPAIFASEAYGLICLSNRFFASAISP
ncbi:Ran guanine nucleotide release factor [Echinococcus granulosus]|uniref:Ran guanine nucleotide release factor n=1 Tax=Echinococcus granulosus TaxID=6210 RepID=A0A068WCB5_ECHGR|nr:Ran guanine nucleotide release factor [Echinococcus granulosus]CDS16084.1 ran guanine nucleotide release factor [Echinococcus granulosus]